MEPSETSGGQQAETCLLMNCSDEAHNQQAAGGLVQGGPGDEPDELMTNCSETMSTTANEEEEEDDEWPPPDEARGGAQRMQSVKNRAATPRKSRPTTNTTCDDQLGQTVGAAPNNRPNATCLPAINGQANNGEPSDVSELVSIISSADQMQAPPSYGTATRLCASLDPSQLNHLISDLRHNDHQQQQQRAQPTPGQATFQLFQQSPATLGEQQARHLQRDKISAGVTYGGANFTATTTTTATTSATSTTSKSATDSTARMLLMVEQPQQQLDHRQVGRQIMSNNVGFSLPINHAPISASASMHPDNNIERQHGQWPTASNLHINSANQYLLAPGTVGGQTAPNPTSTIMVQSPWLEAPTNSSNNNNNNNNSNQQQQASSTALKLGGQATSSISELNRNESYNSNANQSPMLDANEKNSQTSQTFTSVARRQESSSHRKRRRHRSASGQRTSATTTKSAALAAGSVGSSSLVSPARSQTMLSSLTNTNYRQANQYNKQDTFAGALTIDLHHQHHRQHPQHPQTQQQARTSNENNHNQQNKQQLYGSSKAAGGGGGGECSATRRVGQVGSASFNHQSPSQPSKTISAHCWLIDSSDEQTSYARTTTSNNANYRPGPQSGAQSPYVGAATIGAGAQGARTGPPKHLTVAVKLQEAERNKSNTLSYPRRSDAIGDPMRDFKSNSLRLKDSARRVGPATELTSSMDLMSAPNRPATWSSEDYLEPGGAQATTTTTTTTTSTAVKRTPRRSTGATKSKSLSGRRRHRRGPTDAKSTCVSATTAGAAASSVVRLSAVLTFVSNLVKRNASSASAAKSNSSRSIVDSVRYEQNNGNSTIFRDYKQPQQAQSISGSLAPYTMPSSVGVSSGTSTSAYATGGDSSMFSAGTSTQTNNNNANHRPPFVQLNANYCNLQPHQNHQSIALTKLRPIGERPLYLANNSNKTTSQMSHHSYEYCDGLTNNNSIYNGQLVHETQFNAAKQTDCRKQRPAPSGGSSGSSSVASHSDLMSEVSLDSGHEDNQETRVRQELHLAQLTGNVMSDNELIPAETTPVVGVTAATSCQQRNQPACRQLTSTTRRARWLESWWTLSSLLARRRRTFAGCGDSSDDQSLSSARLALNGLQFANGAQHEQRNESPAARYRSLRALGNNGGGRPHRTGQQVDSEQENNSGVDCCNSRSTFDNVMSLAKADRVFRCRLMSSILVSVVLFVLICLLASLIHRRSLNSPSWQSWPPSSFSSSSARFYSNRESNGVNGRLSLLVDDLDSDLSWLWPPSQPPSAPVADQSFNQQRPAKPSQLDDSIRSLLMAIDQSDRLQQFQQSISHLTNIQLANDNFIDVTQLATLLVAGVEQPPAANQSAPDEDTNNATTRKYPQNKSSNFVPTLSAQDHDLVSLTLLSNLHWPLVKWRHQSQQSMAANFLSFAISPSAPTLTIGASQTLRNLLSSLLLAESIELTTISSLIPNHTTTGTLAINLKQFHRLNVALRSVSHQLLACSLYLNEEQYEDHDDNQLPSDSSQQHSSSKLKARFCHLLVHRYKRMMFVLSELNHNHLFELHQQQTNDELPLNIIQLKEETMMEDYPMRHQKNLVDFLLDRLALLDIETLSESILANQYDNLMEELNEEQETNMEASQQQLLMLDIMTNQELILQLTSLGNVVEANQSQSIRHNLIELTRETVGESPLNLNVNLDKDLELEARFQQLMRDNYDHWRQVYIFNDLINPWPARNKLSLLSMAHNYDLFLHPNLTTKLILGMVKIDLRLLRPTRFVVLNCNQLNLVELSVWLKEVDLGSSPSFSSSSSSAAAAAAAINPSQRNHSQPQQLKQVPIRRVMRLERQEQIFVEFYEPINAIRAPANQNELDRFANHRSNIDFTGELPVNLNHSESTRSLRYTNQFLINISFNKTNLMRWTNSNENQSQQEREAQKSLEFVHYVDYFAQPEAEIKTLLFSRFNGGPGLARQVFPCFDEPHLRATFQLNIVHQLDHQVLFTSQKRERVPYNSDGSHQMSVFESSSIPLATHSIGFVVCDSQNIKSIGSRVTTTTTTTTTTSGQLVIAAKSPQTAQPMRHHIQVQISAQFEQLSQAEFASQLVSQLLSFYQTFLHFNFPAEKLDLLVVPKSLESTRLAYNQQEEDLISSQVEQNFGLVLFKSVPSISSSSLLVDSNLISQDLLEQISLIVSHQIAQQYFGQIVGLHNWRADFWLFRALCQYLESLSLAQVQTDWHLDEQFQVTSLRHFLQMEQFNINRDRQSISGPGGANEQTNNNNNNNMNKNNLNKNKNNLADNYDNDDQATFEIDTDLFVDQTQTTDEQHISGLLDFDEQVNKRAAIVHMLMFNLLPSIETQARFMRRLVANFKFKSMNSGQFWRHFGQQLLLDSSIERLTLLDTANYGQADQLDPATNDNLTTNNNNNNNNSNERIVFVRRPPPPPPPPNQSNRKRQHLRLHQEQDIHRVQAATAAPMAPPSSQRLVDNLDLIASKWLRQSGFPLVQATSFRDRLQLHQERFTFAWSSLSFVDESDIGNATNQPVSLSDKRKRRHSQQAEQQDYQEAPDIIWPIPLMFVSKLSPKTAKFVWFNQRDREIPLVLGSSPSSISLVDSNNHYSPAMASSGKLPAHYNWFKLNVNQSSPIRVNYDERNWEALSELLLKSHYSNHQLSSLDRANLLDDALTLMRAGRLSVGVAMNLTLYLELGERDFQPWSSALFHLDQMQTLLSQNPLWHRYVLKLLQPISVVIGWKDDGPHLMRKLRRNLFQVALQFGDDKTVNKAKQEFKLWFKSGRFIVPNLQELVYVAGVRYGDQSEWFHCWQRYQQLVALDQPPNNLKIDSDEILHSSSATRQPLAPVVSSNRVNESPSHSSSSNELIDGTNNEMEKRQLLTALASTQNTWLLEQFLNYSLDSTKIQTHHLKHVVKTLGKNPVARLYLWRFVRLNWLTLMERYCDESETGQHDRETMTTGSSILRTMILESTKHFATKLDYDEVRAFFDAKRKQQLSGARGQQWHRSIDRSIRQSLNVIDANIHWRNSIEPRLTKWLSNYNNNMIIN